MENKILAYIGAIIDGEGCICLKKVQGRKNILYPLVISVSNTSKDIIELLNNNFIGNLSEEEAEGNNQKVWRWELTSYPKEIYFLEKIIPYLLIKREQAELALQFAKQRENINQLGKYDRFYTEEQIQLYNEIKKLKKEYPTELPSYNFTEEEKLYYLSGLIDGDGCVRLTKAIHKNQYSNEKIIFVPMVSVINTDKRISEFLTKEFQGFTMMKDRHNDKWKSIYQWYMQGISKKDFFLKLKDKLIIKNCQLNLLLRYIEIRENNYKHTDEELQIFIKLKELNGKNKEEQDIEKLKEYTELKRSPRKFFIEKDKLEDLYLHKKLSIRQIAKLYDVQFESVRLRLKKEGITIRTSKEGIKLNPTKLTDNGRKAISEAVSRSKKEAWKDPEYRKKMEKNLEIARSKIPHNFI